MTDLALDVPVLRTVDEFLAWAETRPERWEFINGVLVMMAGASDAHVVVTVNLTAELRARLRGGICRPFGSDRVVRAGRRNGFFPDVSVACRMPDGSYETEPRAVFEVLSPSTGHYDRDEKWLAYQRLAKLEHYVLLAQHRPRAEIWTRAGDGWRYRLIEGDDAVLALPALDIEIPLAALYEDVPPAPEASDEL